LVSEALYVENALLPGPGKVPRSIADHMNSELQCRCTKLLTEIAW
jgi:hypothetical protein